MLKFDLLRVFEEKGIENPNQFLKKCGITSHTSSRLLNNKISTISFKHLETICLQLNCTIDDLFTWSYEDKTGIYQHHTLQKLKRGKKKENIVTKLKELPLDRLNEVRNFIEEMSKK